MKGATYVEAVLNALYRGVSLTAPVLSLALYSDTGAVTELVGSGYARVLVGSAFLSPVGGTVTLGTALSFPEATGTWSVQSVALVDALGVVVISDDVTATILVGQVARFSAGSITGAEA